MALFNSSNPALSEKKLEGVVFTEGFPMTVSGTLNKTLLSVFIVLLGGALAFFLAISMPGATTVILTGSAIAAFVLALVTIFKPNAAPYTAPLYAVLEGLFLGNISLLLPLAFNVPHVIVIQALAATAITFFVMLFLYRTKVIKVTQTFRSVVIAATFGIATVYLIFFIMSFFGAAASGFFYSTSWLSIGVTAFACIIAALNLALDFDLIDRLAEQGAPKYYEWYGAFSITLTLVWLYLELLKLFAKLYKK